MHMPPPDMVRNTGACFDQTLDLPVNGHFSLLTPDIALLDHMREVVSKEPRL